jgi:hypothetical protein
LIGENGASKRGFGEVGIAASSVSSFGSLGGVITADFT